MCKWGTDRAVMIRQRVVVDDCIADLIVKLNDLGIQTVSSCCGHGKGSGSVLIMPSSADRARTLGYLVTASDDMPYPQIVLPPEK